MTSMAPPETVFSRSAQTFHVGSFLSGAFLCGARGLCQEQGPRGLAASLALFLLFRAYRQIGVDEIFQGFPRPDSALQAVAYLAAFQHFGPRKFKKTLSRRSKNWETVCSLTARIMGLLYQLSCSLCPFLFTHLETRCPDHWCR